MSESHHESRPPPSNKTDKPQIKSPEQIASLRTEGEIAPPPSAPNTGVSSSTNIQALQAIIGNQAVQRLIAEKPPISSSHFNGLPPLKGVPPLHLQRSDNYEKNKGNKGSKPIIFGRNTKDNFNYGSVLPPGHTVEEIVNYLYMLPDIMINEFRQANPGVTDNMDVPIPAGHNLHIPPGKLTEAAEKDFRKANDTGTMLSTEGMSAGEEGKMLYTFSAAGEEYKLNEEQMRGMIANLKRKMKFKASVLKSAALYGIEKQREHKRDTWGWVRWLAGGDMVPESSWNGAIDLADEITMRLDAIDLSKPDEAGKTIANLTRALEATARHVDDLESRSKKYFKDTISGAELTVSKLEFVRDASFAIAAGCALIVATPVAVASVGAVTGTTTTAGLATSYVVGGVGAYEGVRSGVGLARGAGDAIGQAISNGGEVDMEQVSQEATAGYKGTSLDTAVEFALLAVSIFGAVFGKFGGRGGRSGKGGGSGKGDGSKPPAATTTQTGNVPETPQQIAARVKAENGEVVVNIGGTGAPHEPAHAINLNPNKVATRKGIPNHVAEPGENVGSLFGADSVDKIVGHHLPPTVLNWSEVAPGSFRVLRSGGRFEVYFRGAHPEDAAYLSQSLKEAGFIDVEVISDVVIKAVKP